MPELRRLEIRALVKVLGLAAFGPAAITLLTGSASATAPFSVDARSSGPPLLERSTSVITPTVVGAVRLGAAAKSLHRKGLIGRLRSGCELDPGQRVAPLRSPLQGWVVFERGHKGLAAFTVEAGAETNRHIGIGATASEARKAYPDAPYEAPGAVKPFAEGFLWVPNPSKPKLTLIIEPGTRQVEAISVPSPNFCE